MVQLKMEQNQGRTGHMGNRALPGGPPLQGAHPPPQNRDVRGPNNYRCPGAQSGASPPRSRILQRMMQLSQGVESLFLISLTKRLICCLSRKSILHKKLMTSNSLMMQVSCQMRNRIKRFLTKGLRVSSCISKRFVIVYVKRYVAHVA